MITFKYATDSPHLKHWYECIGKITANFSALEFECVQWHLDLTDTQVSLDSLVKLPFVKRVKALRAHIKVRAPISQKAWQKNSFSAWDEAVKLAYLRNRVAHNPITFFWKTANQVAAPDGIGVMNMRTGKVQQKTLLSRKEIEDGTDKIVVVVKKLEAYRQQWNQLRDNGWVPPPTKPKGSASPERGDRSGLVKRFKRAAATESGERAPVPVANRSLFRLLAGVMVGLATVIAGFGYGVEKWRETIPTIELTGDLDQNAPFSIPVEVHNRSTFLSMQLVAIVCHVKNEFSDDKTHDVVQNGSQWAVPSGVPVEPGKSQPFLCNFPDKFRVAAGESGEVIPLKKATMEVGLSYDTSLVWQFHRHTAETFTAFRTANGIHWAKGNLL